VRGEGCLRRLRQRGLREEKRNEESTGRWVLGGGVCERKLRLRVSELVSGLREANNGRPTDGTGARDGGERVRGGDAMV